ncbi:hypothetical protein Bca4012_069349 [Brassica carinata]
MALTVAKSALEAVREKGLGGFLRMIREEGFLRCLPDGNLLQTKIHNIGATLVGVDKFGNKYYQKLGDTQYGRHRWVEYASKDRYNASQVPAEWHGWLHFITDHTGDEKPKRYGIEHKENFSGEGDAYIYHSKGHTLNPGQKNWTRYQPWVPTKTKQVHWKQTQRARPFYLCLPEETTLSNLVNKLPSVAAMVFDSEKQSIVSLGQVGDSSSDGISSVKEPLIEEKHHSPEDYSVLAAIPSFLFPALGALLFGYEIGATSCAIISIKSPTLSGVSWYSLSPVDVGIITSGSLYGALIGSIVAFSVADTIGRRKELILAAFFYLVGAIVTSVAPVFSVLIIGRLIQHEIGFFLFFCPLIHSVSWETMHAAPMYIAETSPSQIRGRMISLKEFSTVIGMVGGYGIGSLWVTAISGWRYMYATITPVPVIMGIGMCWLPASPRWLLLRSLQGKGNVENLQQAAIRSLRRLRGSVVVDSAVEQVDEILAELSSVGEGKEATLGEIFQGKCLKALTIAGGLVLLQQITGQPSVLYYAPSILQTAGFSAATDATRISILLGLLKLVMTGVAVIVIDKLGRRPLLFGGVSGMVISLFLLGSYYIFYNTVPAVAVVALLLYVGCYQLSFGPIGWLMISEIFPLKLRGRGISIAVLVNFGTNALVTFAFSPLKELLGAGVLFFGFGVICVVSLFFIYFIVPETKGLTLEEIEAKCL